MKYVPILAAIVLGIVLLIQHGTDAGPPTAPRAVPIIVQEVMPPSKMVAVVHQQTAGPNQTEQVAIPLDPGQVFILTAWSSLRASPGWIMREGPANTVENRRDEMIAVITGNHAPQHVFPTGIRFPRNAAGMADLHIEGGVGLIVYLHGYITDDF